MDASVRDNDAKFIWYDQIDKILSLTAKANGVPGAMNQEVPVPGTGTSSTPTDVCKEADGDGEPYWMHSPYCTDPTPSNGADQQSNDTTPRTRAMNLFWVLGKCINSTPAKRTRVDRNLMNTLDRLADSTTKIERLKIKAALTMHKDNLIECPKNIKL